MPEPKQHHYVHQSYLEHFVVDGKPFCIVDKWNEGKSFSGTPSGILKEARYFSQPIHEEERLDPKLETFFSQVEGRWPSLVAVLENRDVLSEDQYASFVEILSMLRVRIPNARKALEACLQDLVIKWVEHLNDLVPPDVANSFAKLRASVGSKAKVGELRLKDLIDEGLVKVPIDPHRSISLMPQLVRRLEPLLGQMKYRSFLHNATEVEFITSDNPVVIYRKTGDPERPEPYPERRESGFCVLFPVTSRIAFFYDSSEGRQNFYRSIRSIKTVRKINSLVAMFADRFIVGGNRQAIGSLDGILNICPVPDFAGSVVLPDQVVKLVYKFGTPIKLPNWKYSWQ